MPITHSPILHVLDRLGSLFLCVCVSVSRCAIIEEEELNGPNTPSSSASFLSVRRAGDAASSYVFFFLLSVGSVRYAGKVVPGLTFPFVHWRGIISRISVFFLCAAVL